MKAELKHRAVAEAVRIGDELLTNADVDSHGLSWRTMDIDSSHPPSDPRHVAWRKSEGLYCGVSGIALFLCELYCHTRDQKYLKACIEGMRWVVHYCEENPTRYYGFYTGRTGVSYVLLRLYEITGSTSYYDTALSTAKGCGRLLEAPDGMDDLMSGTAGTTLGLLHLHAVTREAWLAEEIDRHVDHLITNAHHGPVGLFWDRSGRQIRGLCGFAHGAAGVGYVFLELGSYFGNPAFYHIAEQAFAYENHFFDAGRGNWPDFRKGMWTISAYEEHKRAYCEGNLTFFTQPTFMNAWCHGAVGIGLSRLRAYELGFGVYADEAKAAITHTTMTDIASTGGGRRTFTPCHGVGGNAEIFLEAYTVLGDEKCLAFADAAVESALKCREHCHSYVSGYSQGGERQDLSLFMGTAGIGLFYLRCCKPDEVRSILLPRVPSREERGEIVRTPTEITTSRVRKRLLQAVFRRTIYLLEQGVQPELCSYFGRACVRQASEIECFVQFIMRAVLPKLKGKQRELVTDVFTLEGDKWRMNQGIESDAWLNARGILRGEMKEERRNIKKQEFRDLTLELSAHTKIVTTKWQWTSSREEDWLSNWEMEPSENMLLLIAEPGGMVQECSLSDLSYLVVHTFMKAQRVDCALNNILDAIETTTSEERGGIEDIAYEQIKEALDAGVLEMTVSNRNGQNQS